MKTTIGGDRLGSGNKQDISLKNYHRSTHDLSYLWRSSMAAGTLVPFMKKLALPGDNFNINLNTEVLTLPTVGPLFGSYKVQLDIFQVPIRLYNAGLHMNRLGIGMDMSAVKLPLVKIKTNNHDSYVHTYDDNEHINESCIFKYLGIGGLGNIAGTTNPAERTFNAVPYLAYWDIYKNYYANKQEERGYVIHTGAQSGEVTIIEANIFEGTEFMGDAVANPVLTLNPTNYVIVFEAGSAEPDINDIVVNIDSVDVPLTDLADTIVWNDTYKRLECTGIDPTGGSVSIDQAQTQVATKEQIGTFLSLEEFDLNNIDSMREDILQHPFTSAAFTIDKGEGSLSPYKLPLENIGNEGVDDDLKYSCQYTQEGLGLKTYQSDLFNNWISTEWIDGANGINEVTAVDTTGDSFTIDSLNLANKVYAMLNRIAISGGTYDDWLDAVYTHERSKGVDSPVYHGSLIKTLAFEEVISNAQTEVGGDEQPLGTLAGRGRLTNKHKGGKINIKVDEPSYIIGIVSLTPRIDYSQGNDWDMNLETLNDLHKPALDAIGYQDLITEQMLWSDTTLNSNDGSLVYRSAGKQPAWINYMTAVNKVYGNFAVESKDMFMVLNRRYDKDENGRISDLTTYIDPTKFNHIFAQTTLDAQNFWVQISCDIIARRKMSAKVIPNL